MRKDIIDNNSILNKYFKIEGNNATLELAYETFSELIDNNFGDNQVEKLNSKLFEDIKNALFILPKNYKVNIVIRIKEFENYNQKEVENIIKGNIELYLYSIKLNNYRKKRNGLVLSFIGTILLIASYFAQSLNLSNIIYDIINISGTLFVWEGISIAYIEKKEKIIENKKMTMMIKKIEIK